MGRVYGIQPWEMRLLTQRELGEIVDDAEQLGGRG